MSTQPMIPGAFVLKMKTPEWHLCVVKQVPEISTSNWMLFGNQSTKATQSSKSHPFQMEFKPHQETMLMNQLEKMITSKAEIRLVLVTESPAISCIDSLWPLKGIEMYRKRVTPSKDPIYSYIAELKHALNMLCLPAQVSPVPASAIHHRESRHSMQTRSKTQ